MRIDIDEERLAVVSDLHLGNPYSLASSKLSSFVDYLIDERFNLCINGDGVDILQARLNALTQQALEVLDLLRKFQAHGGRIYYVIGNHDITLERVLHTWLADYLAPFLNLRSGQLRVRIEHGHLYDQFYAASPRVYEGLSIAAGPLLRIYPDIYRVWSATTRSRMKVANAISDTSEGYESPEQEAAAMIANRGFDAVVFGHTHRPERIELDGGGVYINSGNWMRGSTFVEIADDAVALRQWDPSGPVTVPSQ